MNYFSIAALYIGINIILKLALAYRVIFMRRNMKTGMGDGGNTKLQRAIRAHANATEYMPLAMIGLLALMQTGTNPIIAHTLGASFTIGRCLHAYGLSTNGGISYGRFIGTVLSTLSMFVIAILCILSIFA